MDYRFDTIALVVSQHYKLLRTIVSESRELRPLTTEEARMADYLSDVVESVGGKTLANYCRERFRQGWLTRDLRSYKIKFVLTKLRDSLKKGPVKDELLSRMAFLTDLAEEFAGCHKDDKRRNKKAREEQALRVAENRKLREERKRAKKENPCQMDLFEEAQMEQIRQKKKEDTDNLEETEDALDNVELLVCPALSYRSRKALQRDDDEDSSVESALETEEDDTESEIKEDKKSKHKLSRAEKKFNKMAQDILDAEYRTNEEEDEDLSETPVDDDLRDIRNSYGTYYGDYSQNGLLENED